MTFCLQTIMEQIPVLFLYEALLTMTFYMAELFLIVDGKYYQHQRKLNIIYNVLCVVLVMPTLVSMH
jgi:hypothetical protein